MKPLILSFFLVLLGISFFTNEKKVKEEGTASTTNPMVIEGKNTTQNVDSIVISVDKTAVAL
ncbi:MAG: hypothetical protein LIP06_06785 [Tannerellaceae bacterium]|nr:hypothetical protein [Tannerellaceae bacterium]